MRSSALVPAALLLLAACAVEHGNVPPPRARSAEARRDSAAGALHTVFDRREEIVAPGVKRLVASVVLRLPGRDSARALMEAVADDARRDTTVAAVRVLGYLPPETGHGDRGGPGLVPFAYLEWVPAGGWDAVSASTARAAHRTAVVFLTDLKAHPEEGEGPQ